MERRAGFKLLLPGMCMQQRGGPQNPLALRLCSGWKEHGDAEDGGAVRDRACDLEDLVEPS